MRITYLRIGIRIGKNKYGLDYDIDYGSDKRTGWSFTWDGSYFVELEKSLIKTIWIGWKKSHRAMQDMRAS